MLEDLTTEILEEFDRSRENYLALTDKATMLIASLMNERGIKVHSITSRVKDRESLRTKIGQTESKYSQLADITDIAGIRIITYFEDDVHKVAETIEAEFDIDRDNSINKRVALDADRFGYLSLHYVCALSLSRLRLTEYRRFQAHRFEIQIRSILQHAWAEMEHDLGYKSKLSVPKEIRRRFSRLAGLLEIADNEFAQLRDTQLNYENRIFAQIKSKPESVPIDAISLRVFINDDPLVIEWDTIIASVSNREITKREYDLNLLATALDYAGLRTICDIGSGLQKYGNQLKRFVRLYVRFLRNMNFDLRGVEMANGASLLYLAHLIIASKKSKRATRKYLTTVFSMRSRVAMYFSNALTEAWDKVAPKKRAPRKRRKTG